MNKEVIQSKLQKVRKASAQLRAPSEKKDKVLLRIAELLEERSEALLKANKKDLNALPSKTTSAFRDRLLLDHKRIGQMQEGLRQVAKFPDPVGEIGGTLTRPNGLEIKKVRSPLGVIFMIFESRPNVAIEAFSLAFKAGNAVVLRGGKESMGSTKVIYKMITDALKEFGFDPNCLWGVTDPDRGIAKVCLKSPKLIDIVVPRGGDGLISYVVKESLIPIIKNDRGLCHVYIHSDAKLSSAVDIASNAKCQRPGVCNAAETFLVHEEVAQEVLPALYDKMDEFDVQWYGCTKTQKILKGRKNVKKASAKSFDQEYLDFKVNCKVVASEDQAMDHISKHGSRHSESIVTTNEAVARRFQDEVDASAVYWNASTRFTDGFEFGLGGELGISTQKLHVRGPVGLKELTNLRWVVDGAGQVRV